MKIQKNDPIIHDRQYTAVVAILDGVPDCSGEILSENVTIPDGVSVSVDFSGPEIGRARLKKEGNQILAIITIDNRTMHHLTATSMKAVVGGVAFDKEGDLVKKWEIDSIALTNRPSDKRLPNLVLIG